MLRRCRYNILYYDSRRAGLLVAHKPRGQGEHEVGDQVTDGCWLTVNDTKSAVALELMRSGLAIADPKDSEVTVYLNALGWELGDDFCVVSYHVSTIMGTADHFYSNNHEVISLVPSVVWPQGGLISARKHAIHSLLKEKFIGLAQEFVLELAKSKRVALQKIRDLADEDGGAKHYWARYESK